MEPGLRLQEARLAARLTQAELASRARVSRALVSAVEAGRHLPRVDAALALAEVLGTTAAALFGLERAAPVDAISGLSASFGSAVRVGFVGANAVTTPARHGDEGWEPVDDVVGASDASSAIARDPQVVVAGCEPGLRLLERLLQARGTRAIAIAASSKTALAALRSGRLHGAVIHFDLDSDAPPVGAPEVVRFHLGRWRVGLAGPRGGRADWWKGALSGRKAVIQRESGAGSQTAFERAVRAQGRVGRAGVEGPRVPSHLAASRLCRATGLPAVTIEPAAAAHDVAFHPLETHAVELWLASAHLAETGVAQLLDALHSASYRRTLESVGGYDLAQLGSRVA
jgi:transcriptional regulator with XRE-family HTH domain/molybdate-binding protein